MKKRDLKDNLFAARLRLVLANKTADERKRLISKLHITERVLRKWETGETLPDILQFKMLIKLTHRTDRFYLDENYPILDNGGCENAEAKEISEMLGLDVWTVAKILDAKERLSNYAFSDFDSAISYMATAVCHSRFGENDYEYGFLHYDPLDL